MNSTHPQAIIVLGHDVAPDGTIPQEAKNRVIKAKELLAANEGCYVIFAGKMAMQHRFTPKLTEAAAMAAFGEEIGIPAGRIIIEQASRSTYQNASFTKAIVDSHGWRDLLVVTGDFHRRRASYIFHKVYGGQYSLHFVASRNGLSKLGMLHRRILEVQRWPVAWFIKRA